MNISPSRDRVPVLETDGLYWSRPILIQFEHRILDLQSLLKNYVASDPPDWNIKKTSVTSINYAKTQIYGKKCQFKCCIYLTVNCALITRQSSRNCRQMGWHKLHKLTGDVCMSIGSITRRWGHTHCGWANLILLCFDSVMAFKRESRGGLLTGITQHATGIFLFQDTHINKCLYKTNGSATE